MKKITKSVLTIGSVATIAAPMASVISCGNDRKNISKLIILQVEKNWVPVYKEIIKDFKSENKELMSKNGINDIELKVMGSFDTQKIFGTKGIRDTSAPDLFLVAGDKAELFRENNWLKPFSEATTEQFKNKYLKDDSFLQSTVNSIQKTMESEGSLYGVPENVEAMISFKKENPSANTINLTKLSDLWMSAGFFNVLADSASSDDEAKNGFNLRDIVWTEGPILKTIWDDGTEKHGTIDSVAEANAKIKNGFNKIIDLAKNFTNQDSLAFKGDTAAPLIYKFIGENADKFGVYAGTWDEKSLQTSFGKTKIEPTAISKTDGWNQWGGGWAYSMNSRMNDKKRNVVEKLISQFYNKKYAKKFFKVAGKLSPTTKGRDEIYKDPESKVTATAVYESAKTSMMKPMDSAFDGVWDAYASVIASKKIDLVNGGSAPTAEDLLGLFRKSVKTAIKSVNDANNS